MNALLKLSKDYNVESFLKFRTWHGILIKHFKSF